MMIRCCLVLPFLVPGFGLADTFTVQSQPVSAVIYADGALVSRDIVLEVPAGRHDVILPDLPANLFAGDIRILLSGAQLRNTQFRDRALPPQPDNDSPEITAAKERIEAAERALVLFDDRVVEAGLPGTAAQAKLQFLNALGQNEGLTGTVADLQAIAEMIEAETLAAWQASLAAQHAARDMAEDRLELEKALENARAALAALTPPAPETSQMTVSLETAEPGQVDISLTYPVQANWSPVYDVYLSGEAPAQLDLRRGAFIAQNSDENWTDVQITLSTLRPTLTLGPSPVLPRQRRIFEPAPPVALSAVQGGVVGASRAEPAMEAPVIMEDAAAVNFDGPGVTYEVPDGLTLASGVDATRIALDTLTFEARRFARANPQRDETAFLMAAFTNTTQEPLLGGGAVFYIDNTLVGEDDLPMIPAGAEAELPFGPIEALRLTHTILDEFEGDRGIISRSNEQDNTIRMEIENLGSRDWQVEVRGAVSYSTQEDLEIAWSATPDPDVTDVEDRRGVLQWVLDVPAQTAQSIEINEKISWPEGMELR